MDKDYKVEQQASVMWGDDDVTEAEDSIQNHTELKLESTESILYTFDGKKVANNEFSVAPEVAEAIEASEIKKVDLTHQIQASDIKLDFCLHRPSMTSEEETVFNQLKAVRARRGLEPLIEDELIHRAKHMVAFQKINEKGIR